MLRSKIEWLAIIGGLITILVVLIYCGVLIRSSENRWTEFNHYVLKRDAEWWPFFQSVEEHLRRQDHDSQEIQRHQAIIIENQMRIIDRLGKQP